MAVAPESDRPLGGAPQKFARLGLLDEPGQLAPLTFAQVPRPAVTLADQHHNPVPLLGLELEQVLPGKQQELTDHDQARSRKSF